MESSPLEIENQKEIENNLIRNKIYPYSVFYTRLGPLVKITLWIYQDVETIKTLINYENLCDKSGFFEFKDSNTILFSGMILSVLFNYLYEENIS